MSEMRVAVIGAGISGLVAATELTKGGAKVVVYEKEDYLGGHAKTVTVDGCKLDLGFMVFNRVSNFTVLIVRGLRAFCARDILPHQLNCCLCFGKGIQLVRQKFHLVNGQPKNVHCRNKILAVEYTIRRQNRVQYAFSALVYHRIPYFAL